MTAITADPAGPLSLLNRDFQSRFLQSAGALTAIAATKGVERVKAWANADGSDAARLSAALILTDTATKLLVEYALAKRRGDAGELRRIDVRSTGCWALEADDYSSRVAAQRCPRTEAIPRRGCEH